MKKSLWATLGLLLFLGTVAWWELSAIHGRWHTNYLGAGEIEGWMWRYWWVKKMLTTVWNSQAPTLYCLWIATVAGSYPETGNLFDLEVLSWPLELMFPGPMHHNVKCLLVLTLNGMAAWFLGRTLLTSRWAAAVSSLVVTISPYCLYEISNGRIRQAILFPLIFFAASLVALWKKPSFSQSTITGFCGGITAAFYFFYGISAGIFAGVFVLWALISNSYGKVKVNKLLWGVVAFVIVILTSAPFASGYLVSVQKGDPLPEFQWQRSFLTFEEFTSPNVAQILKQNDPLLNSIQRFKDGSLPWQYPFTWSYYRNLPLAFTALAFLSLPLSLCFAFLAFRRKKQALVVKEPNEATVIENHDKENKENKTDINNINNINNISDTNTQTDKQFMTPGQLVPWVICAVFFYILTLGPYIRDVATQDFIASTNGGQGSPIYLWLFKYMPAFSRLFAPDRMSGMLLVSVSVLVGAACEYLFIGLKMPKVIRALLFILIAGVSLFGLKASGSMPVLTTRIEVPEYYYRLAKQKDCTIVEMPFRTGDSLQYYQVAHEKKLLLGWSDGATPPNFPKGRIQYYTKVFEGLPENSFLQFLENLNVYYAEPTPFTQEDFDFVVKDADVQYLVVHERGCYQIDPSVGGDFFDNMLAILGQWFGEPCDTSYELVYNDDGSVYKYRLAVFATKQ